MQQRRSRRLVPCQSNSSDRVEAIPALPTHPAGSNGLVHRLLDGFHIEAGAALHRGKLDQALCSLGYLLLSEHKAPELVRKPVVIVDRSTILAIEHAGALVGIEAQVGQDRPVNLLGGAEPAAWLIREAILEVIDAHCGQRGFSEI